MDLDSREIAVISGIAYFFIKRNTSLYGSKVLLFGHINLYKKLFGNRKYNWGTLPRVREVFIAIYQEIGVKPHYRVNIRLQGYFEWSILSSSLINSTHIG